MAAASPPGTAALQTLPPPTTATATATATTAASALSSDCLARVHGVIADDIRQLSRDDLDVRRWLNAAVSRVLEAAKDVSVADTSTAAAPATPRRPLQLEEHLVQLLYARVQTHNQELSASIEDLVSATLVRLPRTTMELTRMSAEAVELTEQLQRVEKVVTPAVGAGSDGCIVALQQRTATEAKLRKCKRLLEKAARVEESLRNVQYLVEHRESMGNKRDSSSASTSAVTSGASAKAATAAQQRDLDEVAGIIRQAREDLQEIAAVDDTFGEQYKSQLEQFEQYIEHALEQECVACLLAHELERATRLMTTLYSIGRADAVLKRYGEQAAAVLADQQRTRLRACLEGDGGNGGGTTAAAAVAEVLRHEIIPADNTFVSRELAFLSSLVERAAQQAHGPTHAGAGAGASGSSTTATAAAAPPTTTTATAAAALEDDPRTTQALEVISIILHKLREPVQAALQPLLTERPDTTNADFVACLSAVQLIKITASTTDSTGTVGVKDPHEKRAREVSHRALGLYTQLFHEDAVLQRYAERVSSPVVSFSTQPLSSILSAAADERDEDSLASVLTRASQEVLLYVPEKLMVRCATAWHASLSKMIAQLQPTPTTSQHTLLQRLYVYKRRIHPLVLKAQQAVEDWLSSGTVRERYPSSASALRVELQTRVWEPLKRAVAEAQGAIERSVLGSITQPILATVASYASLPCWGSAITNSGSPSATPGAAGASAAPHTYTHGQAAPSGAVRDMGEMLMELPLTLETLGSSAVAEESRRDAPARGGGGGGDVGCGVTDADAEEGVRMLIEEQAEEWLDTVVEDVVDALLQETVLPLQIGPFGQPASAGAVETTQQRYAAALEQLATDLDYIRNILSAVKEESLQTVEQVLQAVQALPPASISAPFVVRDAVAAPIAMAGSAATSTQPRH